MMAVPSPHVPSGVGIYTRSLRRSTPPPRELARRARDHRLSFVPLLGVWQDERGSRNPNDEELEPYADALHAAGIDVWLWGYPHAGRESSFVDAMVIRARRVGASGVILDPEVSYKGRPRAMERLVRATFDGLDESLSLGFTSYGQPSAHRTFPWEEAGGVGWGGPQLYSFSAPRALRGIQDWARLGWTSNVPALPTFGPRSKPAKLQPLVDAVLAEPSVRALLFWSWNTADARDLRAIARAAERLSDARRAPATPMHPPA